MGKLDITKSVKEITDKLEGRFLNPEVLNDEVLGLKEITGDMLRKIRIENNISKHEISKRGLRTESINAIENNSSAYTIDNFLKYILILDSLGGGFIAKLMIDLNLKL